MRPETPGELLDHFEGLRRRARAGRRGTSVPLLVFGVLSLLYPIDGTDWFWMLAGPVGFVAVAVAYRRRAGAAGLGSGRGLAIVISVVLLSVLCLAPLTRAPSLATAGALALLAVLQGNRVLLWWAAGFAVVMGVGNSIVLSGSDYRYDVARAILGLGLGVAMTVAGVRSLRAERAAA